MIRFATIAQAREVVSLWKGMASTVKHIGNSASSVFEYYDEAQTKRILRLTDTKFRTPTEIAGEIEFVNWLNKLSVSCAYPIATVEGELFVVKKWDAVAFACTAFTYAEGLYVNDASVYWNKAFALEWGRHLAAIHAASRLYQPQHQKLWHWQDEILFREKDRLFPKNDLAINEAVQVIFDAILQLPKSKDTYGVIHADHAPQNFSYDPVNHKITTFDFGNSCYHWYGAELANSLSTIEGKKNADTIRDGILEGYSETMTLPDDYKGQLQLFTQLRRLYVYLDRLYVFGEEPGVEQRKVLEVLRSRVLI